MIRFVIPAYDEAENIPRLLENLAPVARQLGARVIVVDDGSSDGTAEIVRAHARDMHLAVVQHPVNSGLGAAINTGIRAALSEASDDDAIVTLEADTTSDLNDLPRMLEEFEKGADMVLASVYMPGGQLLGVSQKRIALSKSVSTTFRYLGGLQNLHTLSSLYRVYRASTLRSAAETYGYLLVREPGFAANVELLLKLYAAGAKIAEVPTTNDWSTRKGQSKMKLRPTALAYFRVMIAHLAGRIQPPPRSPLADVARQRTLPSAAPVRSLPPAEQRPAAVPAQIAAER
jgi:dolichol-phosphate mannosyltransferase